MKVASAWRRCICFPHQQMQSFRFLNPNSPFLFQFGAPTLKHCATVNRKIQVDINRVSTNLQAKPKAIWVFLLRDFCSHLSLLSLLSKSVFPEQKSWAPGQRIIRSSSLGTNFRNPDYTTPNRSRKRTAIRSSSVWGSKDDLFPVEQNPTKSIQNLQTWLNICHVISSHNCKRSNSKVIQWSKNNCGFLWLASGVECLSKGFH